MNELGRINITKVLLLSSHIALPREGKLEAAVYVMTHVGQRYHSRLMYDPFYPEIDHTPEPQRKEKDICMFVESNHARDKVSCRSRKWFLDICEHSISAVVLKKTVYSRDISFWC